MQTIFDVLYRHFILTSHYFHVESTVKRPELVQRGGYGATQASSSYFNIEIPLTTSTVNNAEITPVLCGGWCARALFSLATPGGVRCMASPQQVINGRLPRVWRRPAGQESFCFDGRFETHGRLRNVDRAGTVQAPELQIKNFPCHQPSRRGGLGWGGPSLAVSLVTSRAPTHHTRPQKREKKKELCDLNPSLLPTSRCRHRFLAGAGARPSLLTSQSLGIDRGLP